LKGAGGCKSSIMKKNSIIPYNPDLKKLARQLRNNSTKSEIILWNKIKKKSMGYEFHRQVPVSEYIVDFYCHELMLAIEIDGVSHDYNYEHDDSRQKELERYGIRVIRFLDEDVKKGLNEVLRILTYIISEIEDLKRETSPLPPLKGDAVQTKPSLQ
jgi:very-short-patch-repair endonuclease